MREKKYLVSVRVYERDKKMLKESFGSVQKALDSFVEILSLKKKVKKDRPKKAS